MVQLFYTKAMSLPLFLKNHRSRTLIVLSATLFVVFSFGLGFFIGNARGLSDRVPEGEGQLIGQGKMSPTLSEDVGFRQFWVVCNKTL